MVCWAAEEHREQSRSTHTVLCLAYAQMYGLNQFLFMLHDVYTCGTTHDHEHQQSGTQVQL